MKPQMVGRGIYVLLWVLTRVDLINCCSGIDVKSLSFFLKKCEPKIITSKSKNQSYDIYGSTLWNHNFFFLYHVNYSYLVKCCYKSHDSIYDIFCEIWKTYHMSLKCNVAPLFWIRSNMKVNIKVSDIACTEISCHR